MIFFFSSRRRHTRFSRDWSSDVCSSDLASGFLLFGIALIYGATGSFDMAVIHEAGMSAGVEDWFYIGITMVSVAMLFKIRSEERRVGKECRRRWLRCHLRERT